MVKARAKALGVTYHFGRVYGICAEKGSELPPGDPARKFKGRDALCSKGTRSRTRTGRRSSSRN